MRRTFAAHWALSLALLAAPAYATPGGDLVTGMGCYNCHLGADGNGALRGKLPALGALGSRYQARFLYDYIAAPAPRRPTLAPARMPVFPLSEDERVAVVTHLEAMKAPKTEGPPFPAPGGKGVAATGETLVKGALGCTACHSLGGKGGKLAPPLDGAAGRLKADWLRRYLIDPSRLAPSTPMPALFYTRTASAYVPRTPEAATQLASVLAYLATLAGPDGARFNAARAKTPNHAGTVGAQLTAGLNCAACHDDGTPMKANAPDLRHTGRRTLPQWLGDFLRAPTPVRPYGRQPDSGGRMPDFKLTDDEVQRLSSHLSAAPQEAFPVSAAPAMTLTPFKREKARRFLVEKLSCLGCHRMDGDGGRVGPDLSDVALRRPPAYIYNMMHAPQATEPGTVMPKERGRPTPKTMDLVFAYLTERKTAAVEHSYLSPLEAAPIVVREDATAAAKDYAKYCASCHGSDGKGDGFNAPFLPAKPTNHTDGRYLSARPDDTLFDGIHVGGFVLDKSHRMPPWGDTLTRAQIRDLVGHLRALCQCTEPAWARDNAR